MREDEVGTERLPLRVATAPAVPRLVPTFDTTAVHSVFYGDREDAPSAARRRESLQRRALAVADAAGLLLAFVVLALLRPDIESSAWYLAVIPAWIVLNKTLRLYDRDANLVHKSTLNELPTIVQSVSFGAALVFMFAPELTGNDLQRGDVITFWAAAVIALPALRYGTRAAVRRHTSPERILIVGSGHVADLVASKIGLHPEYGATVQGYVDATSEHTPLGAADIALLGGVADFEAVCREHRIDRVVIAFSALSHENLLDMVRVSKRLQLRISVVPRLFEAIGHSVEIDQIEGMTLLGLRGLTRTKSTLMLKRSVDVVLASLLLLLSAPVIAVAALAIKLTSPGPVLFVQRRVGRGNQPFPMFKLRTMVEGADEMKASLIDLNELADRRMFKIAEDPRVTRVGRILRRTSIDELPQLINVLRGEMSIVGPRPLVADETDQIIGWHRARLDLTPGLTGPWQVMGRNAIPFEEMVKLDYLYVAEWSLWNDFKLILRTLPVVVGRRGS